MSGRCLAVLLLVAGSASAQPGSWQWHGFASQGFVKSAGNSFYGDSLEGSWRLREAGLNVAWRPGPRLTLTAQGLVRQAGEHDIPPVALDYLSLNLSLLSTFERQDELRVGRIKLPLGLYNETRDVAATRPSILLPQSIYFDRTRDLALSADGLLWAAGWQRSEANWSIKAGVLRPRVSTVNVEDALFSMDLPGSMEPGLMAVGRIGLEHPSKGARLFLSGLYAWADYPGSAMLPGGRVRFLPVIASLAMDREHWSLAAEFALRPVRYAGFEGSSFEGMDVTGESYYLQGQWHLSPRLHALIRYDDLVTDREDPTGARYAARTGLPAHGRFARDWTLGLSFAPSNAWRLQLERHDIDGTAWLTRADRLRGGLARRWTLWAAMLAYRF